MVVIQKRNRLKKRCGWLRFRSVGSNDTGGCRSNSEVGRTYTL